MKDPSFEARDIQQQCCVEELLLRSPVGLFERKIMVVAG